MEEDLAYFLEQRNNAKSENQMDSGSYMKQMSSQQASIRRAMGSQKLPSFKMPKL